MNITIPAGKHYDFSLSRLWYRFVPFRYKKNKVISFTAKILSEPYDIRPDADQDDRHKLFGINLNFWKPANVNSIMVSFQPNPKSGTWDIAMYVNDEKGWVFHPEFPSKPGDEIRADFKLVSRNRIELYIYLNGERMVWNPYFYEWQDSEIRFPSIILPWHGGKDNDGNGIGGISPVDLRIQLEIK